MRTNLTYDELESRFFDYLHYTSQDLPENENRKLDQKWFKILSDNNYTEERWNTEFDEKYKDTPYSVFRKKHSCENCLHMNDRVPTSVGYPTEHFWSQLPEPCRDLCWGFFPHKHFTPKKKDPLE